jgi:isopentenyl-diphosphate delta-isomerase type 1
MPLKPDPTPKNPMTDELLDEVDANDAVMGPRRRSELHRLGLRHRAVHILLFNSQGQLFLQKRSMNKDVHPGFWDTSAAGHVDRGESYEQSARRELEEELGIGEPADFRFLFKMNASAQTGWEFIQTYQALHDGPLQLNEQEISEGRWLDPDELDAWIHQGEEPVTRSFRLLWRTFLDLTAPVESGRADSPR